MDNSKNDELQKKKLIRYVIIIAIVTVIVASIIITIVVLKNKKRDDSENKPVEQEPEWDNIISKPSEEEMKELKQSAYTITTAMSQSEIQEILSNDLYQIIHFTSGIYNLKIEHENKINGLAFSRKRYVILEEGVIFNVVGEPFKKFTDYYAILFVRVEATKEEPMTFIGKLEINGNRNPLIDKDYKGQCGMGLAFYSSQNINFEEIYSYNNHGDGIYIGSGTGRTETGEIQCNSCSNINIGKATCKGNYRNGISVIAGNNIIMNEIYIEDAVGSDPQAGIDFEPNHICERIDIKINKIFSKNNYHCGVTTYTSESESIKVSVNEVHSNNDAIAFINGNFGLFAGDVTCDKIKYYFHFKKVYFNYIERRKEYIVTQNWDKGCHSLVVDNITIIE